MTQTDISYSCATLYSNQLSAFQIPPRDEAEDAAFHNLWRNGGQASIFIV